MLSQPVRRSGVRGPRQPEEAEHSSFVAVSGARSRQRIECLVRADYQICTALGDGERSGDSSPHAVVGRRLIWSETFRSGRWPVVEEEMEGAAGSEMTEREEFGWLLRERVSGVGHRHGADTI